MLDHEDYSVGWICPLEVEQIAAVKMLDEIHERLPQTPTDDNGYILGSIKGHNVVISGLYKPGNCAAATVVADMKRTFPNLRFGLLVGIGGGVPKKTDSGHMIRLGHVVVSKPAHATSGVVQYDHGKVKDGNFERVDALSPPPPVLLNAARLLAIKQAMGEDPLMEHVKRITNDVRLRHHGFKSPDTLQDHLYHPDYPHQKVDASCMEAKCDPSQRIYSVPDDGHDRSRIIVHRGIIASGERVVKDANLRDQLAEQFGALCVEMEAGGTLAGKLACIVIRGISDYCDSHKNDEWHGYAAAVAAAYARELFFHMPVDKVLSVVPPAVTAEPENDQNIQISFDHLQGLISKNSELRAVLYLAAFNPFKEPLNAMVYFWLFKAKFFERPTIESLLCQNSGGFHECQVEDIQTMLANLTGGILAVTNVSQRHRYFRYQVDFTNSAHRHWLRHESQCSDARDEPFQSGLRNLDIYSALRAMEAKFAPEDSPDWEIGELFRHTFDWLTTLALNGHEPEVICLSGFEGKPIGHREAFRPWLTVDSTRSLREKEYGNFSFVHWAAYRCQGSYVQQVVQERADGGKSVDCGGLNLLLSASLSTNLTLTSYLLSKDGGRRPEEPVTLMDASSSNGRSTASVWMVLLRDFMNNLQYYWRGETGKLKKDPPGRELLQRWSDIIEAYLKAGADSEIIIQIEAGNQMYFAQLRDIFHAFGLKDIFPPVVLPSTLQYLRRVLFREDPMITRDILWEKGWIVHSISSKGFKDLSGKFRVRVI